MMEKVKKVTEWIGQDAALVQLLEPLFLYGVGIGLLFASFCFFFKQEVGRKIGLAVLIVCCALIYPYLKFSEKVLDDIRKDPELGSAAYRTVVMAMESQYEMRYNSQWYYYALGGLAAVSLLVASGRVGMGLSALTIMSGTVVVAFGLYMDMRDKKVHYVHLYEPEYVISEEKLSSSGNPGKSVKPAKQNSGQGNIVKPKNK